MASNSFVEITFSKPLFENFTLFTTVRSETDWYLPALNSILRCALGTTDDKVFFTLATTAMVAIVIGAVETSIGGSSGASVTELGRKRGGAEGPCNTQAQMSVSL